MGRPKGSKNGKKDKFAALDSDFKTTVESMKDEDIRKKVSDVALAQEALLKAKEEDQDYTNAKEQFSIAGEVYREGTKLNRLRIQYCKYMLEARGKDADGSFEKP